MRKQVSIRLIAADPNQTRAWGEVKALDVPGRPTVAGIEAALTYHDVFTAAPGDYSFHFAVDHRTKVTLTTIVDGTEVGPRSEIDATTITAGQRYHFEVP